MWKMRVGTFRGVATLCLRARKALRRRLHRLCLTGQGRFNSPGRTGTLQVRGALIWWAAKCSSASSWLERSGSPSYRDCTSSLAPGFENGALLPLAPLSVSFPVAGSGQYFENGMAGIVFCRRLVSFNKYTHLCNLFHIQPCALRFLGKSDQPAFAAKISDLDQRRASLKDI